jgi:hypothetical protein
MNFSSAYHP